MGEYIERDDGVHLRDPLLAEFTLCGDAFDMADTEGPETAHLGWRETRRRTVTCALCAKVILGCRGVRVDEPDHD